MKLENAKPKINHLYEEIVSNDAAEMSVSNGFARNWTRAWQMNSGSMCYEAITRSSSWRDISDSGEFALPLSNFKSSNRLTLRHDRNRYRTTL